MTALFVLAPVIVLAVSALTAIAIFLLPEEAGRARTRLNLTATVLKL